MIYRKSNTFFFCILFVSIFHLNLNIFSSFLLLSFFYNTPDANFKAISHPKNYSIIVHPEYSNITVIAFNNKNKENKIKVSAPSVNIIPDESDLFLIF